MDGTLINPTDSVNLGGGNVLKKSAASGELDMRLSDGTHLIVMPLFWASQSYWYLDVQVLDTPAREGVMGHILKPDWLPRAPNGSSLGPRPGSLVDRHLLLNHKFAVAWRVSTITSMGRFQMQVATARPVKAR